MSTESQKPARAAQYLRMSTEHQRYSTEHQAAAIGAYAFERGLEIVRTYRDDGISGLNLRKRHGLQALLADVIGGRADFNLILVYDVSRWGRFQDVDESAHYEFICRQAGVPVAYCAEAFENDGSMTATLVKYLKRAMAAEYSRELSSKVSLAQRRLAAKGFHQGGRPGYGLRRLMVDEQGHPVRVLEAGEQKALQGYRVVLTWGPQAEIETVRRIYRLFAITGMHCQAVADLLNAEGVGAELGRPWTRRSVHKVLISEKYVGEGAYNRVSVAFDRPQIRNPEEDVVRVRLPMAAIVSRELFERARDIIGARICRASDGEVLRQLRSLADREGYLSAALIHESGDVPSMNVYRHRFGSLMKAYELIGYRREDRLGRRRETMTDAQMIEHLRALHLRHGRLHHRLIDATSGMPCADTYRKRFGTLRKAYARVGFDPTGTGPSRRPKDARYSEAQMLETLRSIVGRHGTATAKLLDADASAPSRSSYARRFGSLTRALALVGYVKAAKPSRRAWRKRAFKPQARAGSDPTLRLD